MTRSSGALRALLLALALIAGVVLHQVRQGPATSSPPEGRDRSGRVMRPADGALREAYRERRSGIWVESAGAVERILPDDRAGSRHQRFILSLDGGQTLLVSHNLDLAPRVPISRGDLVRFRGLYEWNELGGLIHWTHHDPDGRVPGGWLQTGSRRYR